MASSSKLNLPLGDAGILRKKEDEEELFVFGYSSKLFRDDDKALYIDQGKHLIPWMGDDTLKIDRYDGRGTLYDLKQYEPLPGGYDESLWVGLSDSERHVEHLCNEERYHALHHNEDEEALYQEEELKRLHQALDTKTYGEVGFNYDGEPSAKIVTNDEEGGEADEGDDEGDEPFKAPPELDIPVNMVLPESVKLNAIIEKTALFISGQGAQMEILLKMKQANNPQFEFLSYTAPLHPYYRHLQMAIKTGRYRPKRAERHKPAGGNDLDDDGDEDGHDHYLHPSLAPGSSKVELAPLIPSIAYKPSADCAYSMLVTRIKDKQAAFSIQPPGTADAVLPPQAGPVAKPAPSVIEATPVLYNNNNSSTEEKTPTSLPVVVASQEPSAPSEVPKKVFTPVVDTPRPPIVTQQSCVPLRTAETQSTSFLTPPPDVGLIVDKMASYVAKNGREFETIVRNKGDPRFAFLEVAHQYYPYYLHKVDVYERLEDPKPVVQPAPVPTPAPDVQRKKTKSEESSETEEEAENSQEGSHKSLGEEDEEMQSLSAKPVVAPVCFSIKKPKETDAPLDKKSALPVEESTDEEEEAANRDAGEEVKIVNTVTAKREEEVIDLTEDTAIVVTDEAGDREGRGRDKKKDRPAEEKVKDKLAAAAREKVAAKARERQLQMERKRRAAAFLTMLRKTPGEARIQSSQSRDASSRVGGEEDDVSSVPSSVSSGCDSPNHDQRRAEDRSNNTNGKSNSLLARIQGGRDVAKRPPRSSSSESDRPKAKKKIKLKEKKKKSSHKRERTTTPSRSHKHRKEDHSKHRKEDNSKYYNEDDQRKNKKTKKQVRSKSPSKGHRTRSHYHPTDRSTSKSKGPRERHSKKKQKRDRKSSSSEHSS